MVSNTVICIRLLYCNAIEQGWARWLESWPPVEALDVAVRRSLWTCRLRGSMPDRIVEGTP